MYHAIGGVYGTWVGGRSETSRVLTPRYRLLGRASTADGEAKLLHHFRPDRLLETVNQHIDNDIDTSLRIRCKGQQHGCDFEIKQLLF